MPEKKEGTKRGPGRPPKKATEQPNKTEELPKKKRGRPKGYSPKKNKQPTVQLAKVDKDLRVCRHSDNSCSMTTPDGVLLHWGDAKSTVKAVAQALGEEDEESEKPPPRAKPPPKPEPPEAEAEVEAEEDDGILQVETPPKKKPKKAKKQQGASVPRDHKVQQCIDALLRGQKQFDFDAAVVTTGMRGDVVASAISQMRLDGTLEEINPGSKLNRKYKLVEA